MIRLGNGLLPLNLAVWVLVAVILFLPSYDALRITIGIPFVLFFPGYTLVLALFPKKGRIGGVERAGLSLGLSIAIVPLIGLALNYTTWGITVQSVSYSIASFIFVLSGITWIRQKRLTEEERFGIEFQVAVPSWSRGIWDRALSVILIVAVVGVLGMLGYVLATPKIGERFSEFYILGLENKAGDYPRQLVMGQEGKVIAGIANSEHEAMSYRVEVMIDGVVNNDIGVIMLEHDEKWEQEVSFIPQRAGENQRVEFLLYKDGEVEPYLDPIHLWIDVREQ